jgi:hypothetical protein
VLWAREKAIRPAFRNGNQIDYFLLSGTGHRMGCSLLEERVA